MLFSFMRSALFIAICIPSVCHCSPFPEHLESESNIVTVGVADHEGPVNWIRNLNTRQDPAGVNLEGRPVHKRRLNLRPILMAKTVKLEAFNKITDVLLKKANDWVVEHGSDTPAHLSQWILRAFGCTFSISGKRSSGRPFTYGLLWDTVNQLKQRFKDIWYLESILEMYDFLDNGGEKLSAEGFMGNTPPREATFVGTTLDAAVLSAPDLLSVVGFTPCDQTEDPATAADDGIICVVSGNAEAASG